MKKIIANHFVICVFLGMFATEEVGYYTDLPEFMDILLDRRLIPLGWLALTSGLIVALLVWGFHLFRRVPTTFAFRWRAALVGFCCAVLDIVLVITPGGLFVLTLVTLLFMFWHVRTFLRTVVGLLKPGNLASWDDVRDLVLVYVSVLAAFTLLTMSLGVIHYYTDPQHPAFAYPGTPDSMIDAFYFSIVVMTTLGLGDIYPLTTDAKLLVAFESLISYIMFGLMIGIITRGIVSEKGGNSGNRA